MPDNCLGVGADKIGCHRRPMGSDHDQICSPLFSFGQDLDINTAKPHCRGKAVLRKRKAGADPFKSREGPALLAFCRTLAEYIP